MPLSSSVSFEGLTKILGDFQERIPQNASRIIAGWTGELGVFLHETYRENLAGFEPSTAEEPLPVGVRSGDLYMGAELHVLNQYAFEEINNVEYSGFIEDGTYKMAPRRPLQDAADQLTEKMGAEQEQILVEIMEG